jgi:hypothetical protein
MPTLSDFEAVWGLKREPILTSINTKNPHHDNLFVGRESELNETIEALKRWPRMRGGEIALVSGAPGVGKTTFIQHVLKCLTQKLYIPLVDYSPAAFHTEDELLGDQDYIRIFSQVETALGDASRMTKLKSFNLTSSENEKTNEENLSDRRQLLINFLLDELQILATSVSLKEPLFIVVDNLDFLSSQDQLLLLRLFHVLTRNNQNIVVIFVGRPMLLAIGQNMPRELVGSISEPLRFLAPVKLQEVFDARFRSGGAGDCTLFCTPKFVEEINQFVDGNIAMGLKVLARLYSDSIANLSVEHFTYDVENGVSAIIGNSLASIDFSSRNGNNFGFVANILGRYKEADRAPPIVILLSLMKKRTKFDKKLVSKFNQEAKKYDKTHPEYSMADVSRLLDWCRGTRMIRRLAFGNIEAFKSYVQGNNSDIDVGFNYGLTNTAIFTLKLLGQEKYRLLSGIARMPFGFQRYANEIAPMHFSSYQSSVWVEDRALLNL